MSLYDWLTKPLDKTSDQLSQWLGTPQGGERDAEGNLTAEGEDFFAPAWDREANEPLEDFYEGRWNDKFTKFGTDNPIINPSGQISDPGNFLTSDELSQDLPSERSVMAAIIAATLGYGSWTSGAAEGAEAGTAGAEVTAAGAETGTASSGAVAAGTEGGAVAGGEALAAGSSTGAEMAPATGASEGYSGNLIGDFLKDYGMDIADQGSQAYQDAQEKARQDKIQANIIAKGRISGNVEQSNINLAEALANYKGPESQAQDASIQYGESPDPIPIQPTAPGQPGPDSVTTTDTPEGRTIVYKSQGLPEQKSNPYGTNDTLESLSMVNDNDKAKSYYGNILGG